MLHLAYLACNEQVQSKEGLATAYEESFSSTLLWGISVGVSRLSNLRIFAKRIVSISINLNGCGSKQTLDGIGTRDGSGDNARSLRTSALLESRLSALIIPDQRQ